MSSTGPSEPQAAARRNRRAALICAGVFFGMVGAAYAAVPLYKAFCQLTGYDGTVRKADAAPDKVLAQTLTIRFDANVRELPWDFRADQVEQQVKIGETKLALFSVTNHADHPVTGRAVFNVVPEQAGPYFRKLDCFCFTEQTIAAGKTVDMPVLYFVDPQYAQDFETRGKREVTLSYTFYPAVNGKAAEAKAPETGARETGAAPRG